MDFTISSVKEYKSPNREYDLKVYPDYSYRGVKDLVTKGKVFYAFWNGTTWSTSLDELIYAIDGQTMAKKEEMEKKDPHLRIGAKMLNINSTRMMQDFLGYLKQFGSSNPTFNTKVLFADDVAKREDYSTNKLSYNPEPGPTPAFDELMSVLYAPEELDKILWFMGVLLCNKASKIQKFMFLYGGKGSGKGTVIHIFKQMFAGYHESIDLAILTGANDFATAQVKEVPLLIDEDTDISKIQKDTNLLKLTAHEPLYINMKYKEPYDATFMGLLITASNQRFKVRNVDSGITRRAVVVEPTEDKVSRSKYNKLMDQIAFELPQIADKAMQRFTDMGTSYYDDFIAVDMMEATDIVYSFVRQHVETLGESVDLKQAADLYKIYLEDMDFDIAGHKRRIKEELKRYYRNFSADITVDGVRHKNHYSDLKRELIFPENEHIQLVEPEVISNLREQHSLLDDMYADQLAQEANEYGVPSLSWDKCKTTLKDIDTSKVHYVQPPEGHIIIDFDIKNEKGEKDLQANLRASENFPPTYMELSKSGGGLHLHYFYSGDVHKLANNYDDDIEIKVFKGKSSLRRMLTKCNDLPIRTLSSGLPQKKEVNDLNEQVEIISWNEKKMRTVIKKCFQKVYHDATKPSIDFIVDTFEQADKDGVKYDLTDMRQDIIAFAATSTNQAPYCLKVASRIKYTNIDEVVDQPVIQGSNARSTVVPDEDITFFDVEVFPNLFMIVWKPYGGKKTTWYNPSPAQVGELMKRNIVGFNNRGYDNHILCGAWNGENNMEIYLRSKQIISKDTPRWAGQIRTANDISYADIYEYSSKKQSLKKWEVELGITHDELEYDFDKPLPESEWPRAAEYCGNDVDATETVFKATYPDYVARKILAELSGLSINSTTKMHAEKFLFGDDPRPQDKFVYTDLSKTFPGYTFNPYRTDGPKSDYFGEDPSEGGYVYSEPGVYENVVLMDVASMHPTSLCEMNYFGPYTQRYRDLLQTRIYIKHENFEEAAKMFDGILAPYLTDKESAEALSYALKIIINIVYGLTSASFDNKFKHKDNVDNIVAKRGALFMMTLRRNIQEQGFDVAHVKTDSIKIPGATEELIEYIHNFGSQYGYTFEHEATYSKMALVNKAVYIAQYGWAEKEKKIGKWDATGAQFAMPVVLKRLFTHQPIVEEDYAITKQAKSPIYIDDEHIGKFANVYASKTGGVMTRGEGEKRDAVTGTKGFKWKLYSQYSGKEDIDMSYYDGLVNQAVEDIDAVGSAFKMLAEPPAEVEKQLLPF
ncbi:MAG: DUF5906 domain-containing protein [Anaerorhabdus sp.]|uniref:DUF5906 domain-containing protein n=1 Tax=Anaerorhabdus sp. TaxID=1872524 RepID=UPI002FC6CE08